MIVYTHCPACASPRIHPVITAEDFTVSHENFSIWHCDTCTLRFTQGIPGAEAIGPYYQSDTYVSHSDTQQGLVNRLYHWVRNITIRAKVRLVKASTGKQTGRLLDVGAGTGVFAHAMQQAGWEVTALEPDATARENAWKKSGLVLQPSHQLFDLAKASFDAITLWHVLEHVHDLHGYLQQFHDLLAPGGKLVIAVPNYTSRDAAVYQNFWAAYDVPRHLYHFSPQSMRQLAAAKGFQLDALQPMWFDSFYVSLLSGQYRKEALPLPGAFWNGLLSNITAIVNPQKGSSLIYVLSPKELA